MAVLVAVFLPPAFFCPAFLTPAAVAALGVAVLVVGRAIINTGERVLRAGRTRMSKVVVRESLFGWKILWERGRADALR